MSNIIFDVDDTLYDLMEPFEHAHKEIFQKDTDADCEELFKASRIYSDEAFYMLRKGKLPKEDEFAYRIIKTYADAGLQVEKQKAKQFEERYRYYQDHIHVPEKITKILDYCVKNQVTTGVLTNGTVANQGKKIKKLGLNQWFQEETMFISDGIGYTKPDERAFKAVQKAMKLDEQDTWFIGDTFEVDVVGAKKAGWHVIWFNHRRRPMPDGEIVPDIEVNTEEDLLETIKGIIE